MIRAHWGCLVMGVAVLAGCSQSGDSKSKVAEKAAPVYFKVDASTSGSVSGTVHFTGKSPRAKAVDMSNDPACLEAHPGKQYEESLVANKGTLANTFVYIKKGLEGKTFEPPAQPAMIDQKGCWFHPRVLGIQTGQTLRVTNSDPVTHSIHPMAEVNREWNHSQGSGEEPLARKFTKAEIMIRVKCNIHNWMHAYIGVVDHPYFAVTGADGAFEIPNLPPGEYEVEAWHETLGVQTQHLSIATSAKANLDFTFKGE